ncbi:MAG: hypothetical protein JJ975_16435 [Bacteroidia bacterium]|nr:hypothetical protein [Bacteroidia bacterium]
MVKKDPLHRFHIISIKSLCIPLILTVLVMMSTLVMTLFGPVLFLFLTCTAICGVIGLLYARKGMEATKHEASDRNHEIGIALICLSILEIGAGLVAFSAMTNLFFI